MLMQHSGNRTTNGPLVVGMEDSLHRPVCVWASIEITVKDRMKRTKDDWVISHRFQRIGIFDIYMSQMILTENVLSLNL